MKLIFTAAAFLISALISKGAYAQYVSRTGLQRYFVGEWSGEGKFGDGQSVKSILCFSADSSGMERRLRGVAPGLCAADGQWNRGPDWTSTWKRG